MDAININNKSTDFTQAVKALLSQKGYSHLFWENDILFFMQQRNATPCQVANIIIEENGTVSDYTDFYL